MYEWLLMCLRQGKTLSAILTHSLYYCPQSQKGLLSMSIQKRVRPGTGVSGLLESGLAFNYDSLTLVSRVVSTLQHRAEAQPEMRFGPFSLALPLIGSPMPDVCGAEMCRVLAQEGALGILHRFQPIESQEREFTLVYHQDEINIPAIGAAIGITGDYRERFQALYAAGCR